MDIHLWEVEHDYYCEGQNFFTRESTVTEYSKFSEFLEHMGDAEQNYNFVFRWDWREEDEDGVCNYKGDDNYRNGSLSIFLMAQRKGYHFEHKIEVCRADEPAVIEYLKPHWEYMRKMWEPLR